MHIANGMYDFDEIIDRRGSGALKVDALLERYGRDDLMGLWVADMDFATPSFITDALRKRLEHPIFGYTIEPEDYRPAICDWVKSLHGWKIRPEWISYIPGVVKGIAMAVNYFQPKKVIIQPPVYHPFRYVIEGCGCDVIYNPLKEVDGTYEMDFDNLEHIADEDCRMMIISNPHNPGGIVWGVDTLRRLARFCYERGIIIISDEIHSDLALFGNKHVPLATVSDEARAITVTFGAPSKTFNIAGIVSSYAIVPDDSLRRRFYTWLDACEFSEASILSHIATIAAFRKGEQWRREMLKYIEGNIRFVMNELEKLNEEFSKSKSSSSDVELIRPWIPQASFLIWLDCRGLMRALANTRCKGVFTQADLVDLFVNKAHLALNDGSIFGREGEGFMRLNVGCPRSILSTALKKLSKTITEIVA